MEQRNQLGACGSNLDRVQKGHQPRQLLGGWRRGEKLRLTQLRLYALANNRKSSERWTVGLPPVFRIEIVEGEKQEA